MRALADRPTTPTKTRSEMLLVGQLLLHEVEAPVILERASGVETFDLFLLRACRLLPTITAKDLDGVLHLGRQVVRSLMGQMAQRGWFRIRAAANHEIFEWTDAGREALRLGRTTQRVEARVPLHFAHPGHEFIALDRQQAHVFRKLDSRDTPPDWDFNPQTIRAAIIQPPNQKERCSFPPEIVELISPPIPTHDATNSSMAAVQPASLDAVLSKLLIDQALTGRVALLVTVQDDQPVQLLAAAVKSDGLLRRKPRPLFVCRDSSMIRSLLAEALSPPSAEEIAESWRQLAADLAWSEPDQAELDWDGGSVRLRLSADAITQQSQWLARAVLGECALLMPRGNWSRACSIAIHGMDAAAETELNWLRTVMKLDNDRTCDQTSHLAGAPSRELAERAFQYGRFRLAHELAEQEDLQDAPVDC